MQLPWPRRTTSGPTGGTVLKALLVAVGLLFLVEGALRAAWPSEPMPIFREDAIRLWAPTPNLREQPYRLPVGTTIVSTNDMGLREVEVPSEKRPGEFRILCLGDSWTFGLGVSAEQTFAKRLQALLRQEFPRRPIGVVNAGVPGYNWYQAYHSTDALLSRYHPDLVLLCGFNDLSNLRIPQMERRLPEDEWTTALRLALRQSRLYRLLREGVQGLRPDLVGSPTQLGLEGLPVRTGEQIDRVASWEAIQRYHRAVARKALDSGAAVISFQHAFAGGVGSPEDFVRIPTPELGEQVLFFQLCPLPPGMPAPMLETDRWHPNPEGHDRMARALLRIVLATQGERLAGTAP